MGILHYPQYVVVLRFKMDNATMIPLYLFNGLIHDQEERVICVAHLLGYKAPLTGEQRNQIKELLNHCEHYAEQELMLKVSMVSGKK